MMNGLKLSKEYIEDFVYTNKYLINPSQKFLSRCIEGGYLNDKHIHPLSIAGADTGDLAILYATANMYGFEINENKAYKTFLEIIGGPANFSFHSHHKATANHSAVGCAHMSQIKLHPEVYSLDTAQIELIAKQSHDAEKKGAQETILKGNSQEGAVIQIQGEWGIYPQYHVKTSESTMPIQVFIFHKTQTDERHRALAKKLVENKAVKLFANLDEEYLYEVLSSTTEDHFFETIKRVAVGLPIFDVIFKNNGSVAIEERDKIE